MSEAIKLKNDKYWDSTGIVHNGRILSVILEPVVLYNSEEGNLNDITLSESATNFEYIEIVYQGGGLARIYNPNGGIAYLQCTTQEDNNINNYLNSRTVKIQDNKITTLRYARSIFYSSSNISQAFNNVRIYKVLGYNPIN